MATALTLTIGTETASYADNLKQHYADVKRRLRANPPITNKFAEVMAAKAERDRQFMERRAARYAEWQRRKKWMAHMHTNQYTGDRYFYAPNIHEERRIQIGLAAETRDGRLAGYKEPFGSSYDFTNAVDVILETHAVTWASITSPRSARSFAALGHARGEIGMIFMAHGMSSSEAARRIGYDSSSLRKFVLAHGEKVRQTPHFLRARSCVKHK